MFRDVVRSGTNKILITCLCSKKTSLILSSSRGWYSMKCLPGGRIWEKNYIQTLLSNPRYYSVR